MLDAHCHISHEKFSDDRRQVLERAKRKLQAIVETGGTMAQNQAAIDLKMQNKGFVLAVAGLAPHYVLQTDVKSELEFIERNADEIVAIGEIGLEYHYITDEKARERQRIVFREELMLAEKLQLPVVIHCREGWDDLMLILSDFPNQKVMLHFFNKPKYLEEALKRGYWISIATLKSKDLDKVMKDCPLNNLLTETDSPFLWREGRNEPANVVSVYERMAKIKGTTVDEIDKAIMANASKFFEMPFY